MKRIQLKCVLTFLLLIFGLVCYAKPDNTFYNKHVIILVDQTKDVQEHKDLSKIYKNISDLLLNENITYKGGYSPSNFSFNPKTDELSLYAFGLSGTWNNYSKSYGQIGRNCNFRVQPSVVTKQIIDGLIHYRGSFKTSNVTDLNQYLKSNLYNLFNKRDPLYKDIQANSGITMSYFAYPCILDKIDKNIPTKEYFIIIVSNFQSGLDGNSDAADMLRLKDLTHHIPMYASDFRNTIDNLNNPFYQINNLHFRFGFLQNDPVAKGFNLKLRSLENTQVYVTSNINLQETDYKKTTYDINDVAISFYHDENVLSIDKLIFKVSDKDSVVYESELPLQLDERKTSYLIDAQTLDLQNVYETGDLLKIEYLFYGTAKDKDGADIMPLVFVADRNYEFAKGDIITLHQAKKYKIMVYSLVAFFLLLAIGILTYIYTKRGKDRKVSIDFAIWPITNTKFMEVKNNKVVSYDCWYWKNGETDRNIYVTGHLIKENKSFAKHYRYKVEYCIEDIDLNEDFSFRPDQKIKEKDGSERVANKYYMASVADGTFSFNVNAFMDPKLSQPNFDIENILSLKVKMRVMMIDGNKEIYLQTLEHKYHFIVKPEIDNSNLWIAFDPGTSGSSIAYGASSNPTDTNDIHLAENEYEDVNGGKHKTHIYPSKIRVDRNSNKIFGSDKIVAEDLVEGEDFLFGNEAEIFWNGNGVNCFQSIKKLLGYSDPQKIASSKGEIKDISGQDLAHILVKGLYNNFEKYVRADDDKSTEHIRKMFINSQGEFTPQRAIVAVPNNYTLVKIQEMVDSVKRLNRFKEVHYIYESEAVMMSYFRKQWDKLVELQDRIFVVYDMGGATINATAFNIKVNVESAKGSTYIRSIDVKTLAKVGYGVGGDDIDFAIIKCIYSIPSIQHYFQERNIDAVQHQRENKMFLIELARRIKLDFIDKVNGKTLEGNVVADNEKLYGHIREKFLDKAKINLPQLSEEDKLYIDYEFSHRNIMNHIVFDNVSDAVYELLQSLPKSQKIELIMSGRSVLYPGIKESVLSTINNNGYVCSSPWDGFYYEDGNFSAELVKKAVAIGACWYAMYSNKINLQHNKVTSAFGYLDVVSMKPKFIPIITQKDEFDEEGKIMNSAEPRDLTLNDVKFIQMLGSNYDEIMTKDIRHKKNLLDEIYPSEITSKIESIEISVDEQGNFDYSVEVAGKSTPITIDQNPYSRFKDGSVKTEVLDENSEAYAFATRNILEYVNLKSITPDKENAIGNTGNDHRSVTPRINKGKRF